MIPMLNDNDLDFANLYDRDDHIDPDVAKSIGYRFADIIDRLYRAAISMDPTFGSHFAYGCFLEEHGRFIESLREFNEILKQDEIENDKDLHGEIVRHIVQIEKRVHPGNAC